MPSLSTIEFLVGEALSGIFRNRLMSFAAVITAAITLAITAGFAVMLMSIHQASRKLPQQFDMAVYVRRSEPAEKVSELKNLIARQPEVANVTYISKEEGWKQFKKTIGADITMDDVIYNPALDSFRVVVKDPSGSAALSKKLKAMPEVDSVLWRQNEVDLLNKISHVLAAAGVLVSVILFLGSVFIIANTIRAGIAARRLEIETMRLIGARPSFISLPFLLEGVLLAALGAVLSVVIVRAVAQYLSSLTLGLQSVTRFFDSGISGFEVFVAVVVCGILLGLVSSRLSIQKYLAEEPQGARSR